MNGVTDKMFFIADLTREDRHCQAFFGPFKEKNSQLSKNLTLKLD